MAEDCQVGDLAICVRRNEVYPQQVQPGAIFTVDYIWYIEDADGSNKFDLAFDFLKVGRVPGNLGYWHWNFRKISPHIPDAEDEETIRLLTQMPEKVDSLG